MSKVFAKLTVATACVALLGAGAVVAIAANESESSGNAAQTQYGTGGQGCTPGYWKKHTGSWVGYSMTDTFDEVFGVKYFGSLTLLEAAGLGGGGFNALARHAVAALLNASNPDVDYDLTEAEIIELVQKAFSTKDPELVKDEFEAFNESGCSIDAHGKPIG